MYPVWRIGGIRIDERAAEQEGIRFQPGRLLSPTLSHFQRAAQATPGAWRALRVVCGRVSFRSALKRQHTPTLWSRGQDLPLLERDGMRGGSAPGRSATFTGGSQCRWM